MRSFAQLLVMVQSVVLLAGDVWFIQEGFHNQFLQQWIQDTTSLPWPWVLGAVALSVAISAVGICLWVFLQPVEVSASGATIRIPLGPVTTTTPNPVTPARVEATPAVPTLQSSSIRIQTSAESVEEHLGFPLAVAGDVALSVPKGPGETPERTIVPSSSIRIQTKEPAPPAPQLVDFLTTKRKFVIVEPPKKEKKA